MNKYPKLKHRNRVIHSEIRGINYKKAKGNKTPFGRLMIYTKSKWLYYLLAFFCMLFIVICELIQPIMIGAIIDILDVESGEVINYTRILWIVGGLLVFAIVSTIIQYYESMSLQRAGQQIIYQIREEVFTKIENFDIAKLNQTPVGTLVTKVTSDTNSINEMFTNVIINLIKNILTLIGVIIAMFIVSVELTWYVLAVTPFIIVFTIIFRIFSRRAYRKVRQSISDVNASLSENISGIKITQTFNQEKKQYEQFLVKNDNLRKNQIAQIFTFSIFRPLMYFLYTLTIILVIYLGCRQILDGSTAIKLSVFVIFYQYIEKFYTPIQQLADQFNTMQSALASSEKVFEILDTKNHVVDGKKAINIEKLKGDIEFRNVWFAYEEEEWILKDVSFKINAQYTVAFVGATGSGKTTILSLIVRNYDIQKGQILIDGIDIKNYTISSLRRNVGQMLQDVFLFSGTIYSNITLREDSISDEEVISACKFVNADKVIEKLPNGIYEEVRERGNNFSAGERQLLSFARVIAHQPNIMILDEATANIDTETEVLIQDSLNKMMNIGTMLIVAHRLSTIQHADKIIVLHKGRIIEEGTHQELLKLGGHYFKLYELQYK